MNDDRIEKAITCFELTKINSDTFLSGREYLREGIKIGISLERERSAKLVNELKFMLKHNTPHRECEYHFFTIEEAIEEYEKGH